MCPYVESQWGVLALVSGGLLRSCLPWVVGWERVEMTTVVEALREGNVANIFAEGQRFGEERLYSIGR